jgi:hypothetical protein
VEQNFTVELMAARYEAVYRLAVTGVIRSTGRPAG